MKARVKLLTLKERLLGGNPWHADFMNFKVCGVHLINKGRNSFLTPSTVCGQSFFSKSYAEMGYIEGACHKKKCIVFYTIVMLPLMVETLALRRLLQRFSNRVSIGP